MGINERIRLILDRDRISNKQVAEWLGMTNSRMSQKFKDGIWDSVDELKKIAINTGYRLDWIITGNGLEKDTFYEELAHSMPVKEILAKGAFESDLEYLKGDKVRTIAVTVDKSGKELMSFVPVRAQAGYMKGYGDPHFIETLPAFSLPTFSEGSYRMFQVDGSSMLQMGGGGLHDGDIVIAQYLEDFFTIRDNRVYVVVCDEGVVVKRCLNRLKSDDQVLILKSDNKSGDYPDMVLHASEIREVWELKAFLSRQLSFATDLWEVISELQAQQALLTQKLNKLDNEKKTIRRAR